MADIFISYASEDRPSARQLAAALESQGWSVWWDRTILPGTEFDEVIERELDAARSVVVLWSEHSVSSRWVNAEAREALGKGKLVPVFLGEVNVRLVFRSVQGADFSDWTGEPETAPFRQLVDALAAKLGPAPGRPTESPAARGTRRERRDERSEAETDEGSAERERERPAARQERKVAFRRRGAAAGAAAVLLAAAAAVPFVYRSEQREPVGAPRTGEPAAVAEPAPAQAPEPSTTEASSPTAESRASTDAGSSGSASGTQAASADTRVAESAPAASRGEEAPETERRPAEEESARLAAEAEREREEAARAAALERERAEAQRERADEQRAAVERLLAQAGADIEALRLTTPSGNNAFDRLQRVLEIDPRNSEALDGVSRIAEEYVALARRAAGRGRLDEAAQYLDRADAVQPGSPQTRAARENLAGLRRERERRLAEEKSAAPAAEAPERVEQGSEAREQTAAATPAPEPRTGPVTFAVLPFQSIVSCYHPVGEEVISAARRKIGQHGRAELRHSFYDKALRDERMPRPGDVWNDNMAHREPVFDKVVAAGKRLGVDGVLMAWYRCNSSMYMSMDTYDVEVHLIDVERGEAYRGADKLLNAERLTDDLLDEFFATR